jgi:hypothetical protein
MSHWRHVLFASRVDTPHERLPPRIPGPTALFTSTSSLTSYVRAGCAPGPDYPDSHIASRPDIGHPGTNHNIQTHLL